MLVMSHSIFDVVSQSHPLLWWHMIGVSNTVLLEDIIDSYMVFSSIDVRKRGALMHYRSGHLTRNGLGSIG